MNPIPIYSCTDACNSKYIKYNIMCIGTRTYRNMNISANYSYQALYDFPFLSDNEHVSNLFPLMHFPGHEDSESLLAFLQLCSLLQKKGTSDCLFMRNVRYSFLVDYMHG